MQDPNVQKASFSAAQVSRNAAQDYLRSLDRKAPQQAPKSDSLTAPVKPVDQPIQVKDVDWNRFGLSNPNLSDGGVNARIKSNNQ